MNGRSPFCVLTSPFVFRFGSRFPFTRSTFVITGGTHCEPRTSNCEPNVNANREPPEPRSVNDAFATKTSELWELWG
jgi:hypothetical protein